MRLLKMKFMRSILIILSVCLSICTCTLYGQNTGQKISLKQAIETGIANNMEVLQASLQVSADDINLRQSKMDRYPDLNGNISHGINQGRSIDPFTNSFINQAVTYSGYGISSGVVLFSGLSMQNTVKQNSF